MTPATAAASPVELDITHMLHREILAARLSTEHGRLPPMVQTIADFINDGPFLGVYVFLVGVVALRSTATYGLGRYAHHLAVSARKPHEGWRLRVWDWAHADATTNAVNHLKSKGLIAIPLSFLTVGLQSVIILAAGVLAALVGLLVGIPALRLKGDYLAIITLGFGMIIVNIINNLPFAGQEGLAMGSASASLYKNGLGFGTAAKVTYLWVAISVTLVCITMMFMFVRSKYGRAIRAIRDDEIAASASGINTSYYKIFTFTFSAFFAGIAGALYTCANATLSTSSFAFSNNPPLKIANRTFPLQVSKPVPINSTLIFDPNRKAEVWRFFTYSFVHIG